MISLSRLLLFTVVLGSYCIGCAKQDAMSHPESLATQSDIDQLVGKKILSIRADRRPMYIEVENGIIEIDSYKYSLKVKFHLVNEQSE